MAIDVGDVLFQDLACGAVCDAIHGVTPGWGGADISHCGIVSGIGVKLTVLEAISPKVRETPLDEFLGRARDEHGRPRIIVSRLDTVHRPLLPEAIRVARGFIGVAYDSRFAPGSAALYCSELLVHAFKSANGGRDFFPERPMTFKDPNTGLILDFWTRYFRMLGTEVPEGVIGSNPGHLSLSSKLLMIEQLGSLSGAPLAP